ncbi:MAG: hypothetical protein HN380_06365 [Victivallales bacterium]|nr:hypothetical protein [Victivallales bacterium]
MKSSCALLSSLAVACAGQTVPWHIPEASTRQIIEITSPVPRENAPVTTWLVGAGQCRLILPEDPTKPLPCYVGGDAVTFVLPGTLAPDRTRTVVAYRAEGGGWQPSPRLAAMPEPADDFARIVLGRAWDFTADQCGIQQWGDRPDHIGKVAVEDGWLRVPITGPDPYFVWGTMFGTPPADDPFRLDSSLFGVLELRVRQSAPDQTWAYFTTDETGAYRKGGFRVPGLGPQTVRIDLAKAQPAFWDGRMFRALRIDLPKTPGITAWVDYVKVLPRAPGASVVPPMTAAQLATSAAAARCEIQGAEPTQTANTGGDWTVRVRDAEGRPMPARPLAWLALVERHDQELTRARGMAVTDAAGCFTANLTMPKTTGAIALSIGLADDLGHLGKAARMAVTVTPAALVAYSLGPDRHFVLSTDPTVRLSVWGLDEFGNRQPVDIAGPVWRGVVLPPKPLRGMPAAVSVTLAETPQMTTVITLTDAQGRTGQTCCSVVAPMPKQRRDTIAIGPNGYLQHADGSLFLPLGGLYANWPHGLPKEDGRLERSVDLFPCGPANYRHGYPWPPEVEQNVKDYLEHCASRGLTALRLMLRNMDLVGKVDHTQLQAVLHMFDLARPLGIKFNVALCEDYVKPPYGNRLILEKVVLPHYRAEELATLPPHRRRFLVEKRLLRNPYDRYVDADVIACQKDYLRELLPILAGREEVFCYEFENEMVRPPMSWCNDMADFIRSIDPHTLILANPHPILWPAPLQWRDSHIDLFCDHPYNSGTPQADRGVLIFTRAKWCLASGKPSLTGEGGVFPVSKWGKLGVSYENVIVPQGRRFTRDQVWMALTAGFNGVMHWTVQLDAKADELGKPTRVCQALGVDLRSFRRAKAPVALAMPTDGSLNEKCYALIWELMNRGVNFDALPKDEAAAYPVVLDLASADPDNLPDLPAVAKPAPGYQATALVAEDGQTLIYLRNAAAVGTPDPAVKACHVREVKPAVPALSFDRFPWTRYAIYDLDADRLVEPVRTADGLALQKSTHDYVVYLK